MHLVPILAGILLILFVNGGESDEPTRVGGRFLWITLGGGQEEKELKGVICPGVGNFAFRKHKGEFCHKYFECSASFKVPHALFVCGKNDTFNRISRTCVPKAFGNCKWCSKEGRHADKTSKHHFIECVGGSVGIRYKCREGKYDSGRKQCKITKMSNVTDVTMDVDYAPPTDIVQFMKDWKEAEDEEKEEGNTPSSSIEEGSPAEESKEHKEKEKDKDKDKEKGKGKGKGGGDEGGDDLQVVVGGDKKKGKPADPKDSDDPE